MIQNIGKTLILWLAIILAVTIGSIIWVQNSLLFYPNTSIFNWSPDEDKSLPLLDQNQDNDPILSILAEENRDFDEVNQEPIQEMEERSIMIPDNKGGISAYYIHNFAGKDFLLFAHANVGNIADRKYVYDVAQEHQLNLVLFDYHGYGKSPKFPTVDGILKDGITVIDFMIKEKSIAPNRIVVWGESLGTAVSAYIAKMRPIKGVVLMAGFSSMPHLVSEMQSLGWVRFPLSMITRITLHSLDTAKWISKAKCPVVIMHSKADDYISFDCGYRNFLVAKEPKLFIEIKGPHNKADVSFEQVQEALTFIENNKN